MFPIPVNIFSWYFTVVLFNFVNGKLVFRTLSRSLENKFNKMYCDFQIFQFNFRIFFKNLSAASCDTLKKNYKVSANVHVNP